MKSRLPRTVLLVLLGVLALAGAGARAAASAPTNGVRAVCPPDPAPIAPGELAAGLLSADDAGVLWKISKDGHASWLYGTIHVARRAWVFPGPRTVAALKASDTVALELDPTDPDIVARLQRAIAQPAGAAPLPAALDERLKRQVEAACLAPAALAGLRPEMRAVTVEVMAGRALGLFPAYGIDAMLAGFGHGAHKTVRSLETPESQAALLVSDDPAETARGVGQVVDELEAGNAPRILRRLAEDWHAGNLDDLAAYGDWCDCLKTPEQRADLERLVVDRNPAMAEQVARWHGEGHALFVAVGTLHMVGPRGLPALLQARGFAVERVEFAR